MHEFQGFLQCLYQRFFEIGGSDFADTEEYVKMQFSYYFPSCYHLLSSEIIIIEQVNTEDDSILYERSQITHWQLLNTKFFV
jgi:hypothetical protein